MTEHRSREIYEDPSEGQLFCQNVFNVAKHCIYFAYFSPFSMYMQGRLSFTARCSGRHVGGREIWGIRKLICVCTRKFHSPRSESLYCLTISMPI